MDPKICLSTFIFGRRYQGYLPLLIYSIKKSYPQYHPIVFIHESLRSDVKENLSKINQLGSFDVIDGYFAEIDIQSVFQGKALRWLLNDPTFHDYDYLYFIDIDMLYCKEPIPLHEQHVKHMDRTELPFSNVVREKKTNNRSIKTFLRRVKNYGVQNASNNYLKGTVVEKRLTGLHFVKVQEYFKQISKIQEKYFPKLKTLDLLDDFQGFSDEPLLYQLCKEAGFEVDKLGKYSGLESINYQNCNKLSFRPHHGIHLGLFRDGNEVLNYSNVPDSEVYQQYLKRFKKYLNDKLFIEILNNSDEFIKGQIKNVISYYNIE